MKIPNQVVNNEISADIIAYLGSISDNRLKKSGSGKLHISTADFVKIKEKDKFEILVTDQTLYQVESESWTSLVDGHLSEKVWEWIAAGKIKTVSSDLPPAVD